MPHPVDTPIPAYEELRDKYSWDLIEDLETTKSMRDNGARWLDKEDLEEYDDYKKRISRAFLHPALEDTLDRVAAAPFEEDVMIRNGDKLHERLQKIEKDADNNGRTLSQYCGTVLRASAKYGLTHTLIDSPITEDLSARDEREQNIHPYFVHISANDLIGWRWRKRNGRKTLVEARWRFWKDEDNGPFDSIPVKHVKIMRAPIPEEGRPQGEYEIWRQNPEKEDDWQITSEGTKPHAFPGLPLRTFYTGWRGFMNAKPPFLKMADLNLAHWQSTAEQRNILRFARFGILAQFGVSNSDSTKPVGVGPTNLFRFANPQADMKYVEHTGKAIGAGRQDLKDLELWMQMLGMKPFVQRTGNETATGRAMDQAIFDSGLKEWAGWLETYCMMLYQDAALWLTEGNVLPEDLAFDVYEDFGVTLDAVEDIKTLIALVGAGMLDKKTALEEIKKRGLISDTVDVEEVLKLIESEQAVLFPTATEADVEEEEEEVAA